MELELCLSLSLSHTPSKVFEFDLNEHCSAFRSCSDAEKSGGGKMWRLDSAFADLHGECSMPKMRLVSWNRQPNEEEDGSEEHNCSAIYEEVESNKVVGWPPIKSWMTKYHPYRHRRRYHNHHHHHLNNHQSVESSSSSKSMFVKVKMKGVAIGRKIDIKLFNSYESLINSLTSMFSHYEGYDGDGTNYTFRYKGREGYWLQLGNVPWKIFSKIVHRIEIYRTKRRMYT